jgi:repressor LexA
LRAVNHKLAIFLRCKKVFHSSFLGLIPTLREVAAHFGFQSSRAAADHLDALKRKGFLESEPGKARSLRLISPFAKLRSRIVDIPLFGSIPAGVPQAREQDAEGCVSVDIESIGFKSTKPLRNAFALRVSGDSMIGKNICDGDIGLFERREARPGDIIAALVDGVTTTLKRLVIVGGRPVLRAENPRYADIIPNERLETQGVLVGLVRQNPARA